MSKLCRNTKCNIRYQQGTGGCSLADQCSMFTPPCQSSTGISTCLPPTCSGNSIGCGNDIRMSRKRIISVVNGTDYAGLNRALKRRVKTAKRDEQNEMTEPTAFLENISKAFDELWLNTKKNQVVRCGECRCGIELDSKTKICKGEYRDKSWFCADGKRKEADNEV